jgi:hypothetical protein
MGLLEEEIHKFKEKENVDDAFKFLLQKADKRQRRVLSFVFSCALIFVTYVSLISE